MAVSHNIFLMRVIEERQSSITSDLDLNSYLTTSQLIEIMSNDSFCQKISEILLMLYSTFISVRKFTFTKKKFRSCLLFFRQMWINVSKIFKNFPKISLTSLFV
jgi:hypothetical protein